MSRWDIEINRRLAEAGLEPVREAEISRELAQHLDDRYAELMSAGLPHDEAVQRTLDELKESDLMTRELKQVERLAASPVVPGDTRQQSLVSGAWQDIRYALRTLGATRGFTSVAVLTLALGIGATTAIFSVVDVMLIRPLSYDPDGRVVRVFRTVTERGVSKDGAVARTMDLTPSISLFKEWQARRDIFDAMAAFKERQITLLDASPVERVEAMAVTPEFFRLFGSTLPAMGRLFEESDTNEPVTVISAGCWRRRFGADPSIVGRTDSHGGWSEDGRRRPAGGFFILTGDGLLDSAGADPDHDENQRVGRDGVCPPQRRDDSGAGRSTHGRLYGASGGEMASSPRWKERASRRFTNGTSRTAVRCCSFSWPRSRASC